MLIIQPCYPMIKYYKIGISFFLSFRLEMINCHKNVLIYALSSGKFLNIRK